MASLLEADASIGKCISKQIYEQQAIRPCLDCDSLDHSNDKTDINNAIQQIQHTQWIIQTDMADQTDDIPTKNGNNLSTHCIVSNVQKWEPLVHRNVRILNLWLECIQTLIGV